MRALLSKQPYGGVHLTTQHVIRNRYYEPSFNQQRHRRRPERFPREQHAYVPYINHKAARNDQPHLPAYQDVCISQDGYITAELMMQDRRDNWYDWRIPRTGSHTIKVLLQIVLAFVLPPLAVLWGYGWSSEVAVCTVFFVIGLALMVSPLGILPASIFAIWILSTKK